VYVLVSKYDEVMTNTNNPILYNTPVVIKMKGMLFTNSRTEFEGASFVKESDDIIPTYPTSPFQPLIVS